jgi:hypothetical protein
MTGLCECGCGEATTIARQTDTKLGHIRGKPKRFVFGHHLRLKWKGRRVSSGGYVLVYKPGHPRAVNENSVFEHILVVEAVLGRFLDRPHVVHHIKPPNGGACGR